MPIATIEQTWCAGLARHPRKLDWYASKPGFASARITNTGSLVGISSNARRSARNRRLNDRGKFGNVESCPAQLGAAPVLSMRHASRSTDARRVRQFCA
jgi:hypothetical protein